MEVVVDVPDGDRCGALSFGGPFAGAEEFFGDGAVVALDLAVVLGGGAGCAGAWRRTPGWCGVSWWPTNERTDELIREYLPKGTQITDHQPYLTAIADEVNERQCAVLGFLDPRESSEKILGDSTP